MTDHIEPGDVERTPRPLGVRQAGLGYIAAVWIVVQVLDVLGESWAI